MARIDAPPVTGFFSVVQMASAGAAQEFEADGLLATVVQHELEHLEGGLFIDHLSRLKRERVVKRLTKVARYDEIAAHNRAERTSEEAGA